MSSPDNPSSDQPTPEQTAQDAGINPEAKPQSGRFQQRIDQLTQRAAQAERGAEDLTVQNQALMAQIQELTGKVEQLSQPPSKKPARDDLSSLLDNTAASSDKQGLSNLEGLGNMVQKAVQEAMAPMQQQQQEAEATAQLRAQQQQSFAEAADLVPGLKQAGSEAQKAFDQIWNANPELATMPNGPAFVINTLAGIMGSGGHPNTDARKAAAQIVDPGSPMQRLDALPGQQDKNQALVQKLSEKGRTQGLDDDEFGTMIGLMLGTARVKE